MNASNTSRPVSQGCNGLGTTDAINLMHATQVSGHERSWVHFSIGSWRCAYHNAWHTCDTRRRCQHIHYRRKRAFTTWDVQSHTTNRRDLLSSHNTWGHLGKPLLMRHLPLMECANIANSMFNRLAYLWIKYMLGVLISSRLTRNCPSIN